MEAHKWLESSGSLSSFLLWRVFTAHCLQYINFKLILLCQTEHKLLKKTNEGIDKFYNYAITRLLKLWADIQMNRHRDIITITTYQKNLYLYLRIDKQTYKHNITTDRHTDRQTYRYTNIQTHRHTGRYTDIQAGKWTCLWSCPPRHLLSVTYICHLPKHTRTIP